MNQFDQFWDALPRVRRTNKKGCREKWDAKKLDDQADRILKWVKAMSRTKEWKGGYNPAPMTIINQERWNDGMPEFETPKFVEKSTTPSPNEAVKWIVSNKELTENQRRMNWQWLSSEGVIVGVSIPPDGEAKGYRIMLTEIYDLSDGVSNV